MSMWIKIFEEPFQHFIESMPQSIKAVLKAKEIQPNTSKVSPIKWLMRAFLVFKFISISCIFLTIHITPLPLDLYTLIAFLAFV